MKIYGLTGGIASGKSTISKIFIEELNTPVIDADYLARRAVEPDSYGLKEIIKVFGNGVLKGDGSLDRQSLGTKVFKDNEAIKILNSIIHPIVDKMFRNEIKRFKELGHERAIYDCPLLIEENLMDRVDEIIIVVIENKLQIQRLMSRDNLTEEEAIERINLQMPIDEKIKYGDYIIYNDGKLEQLKNGVLKLWRRI